MDRKSIVVVVACGILLVLCVFVITPKYLIKPAPPTPTNAVATAQSAAGTNALAVTGTNGSAPITTSSTNAAPQLELNTNVAEQLVVVTNENARYTFTSYGGGLKLVELLNYPEVIPSWRNKKAQANGVASLNSYTPSPTLAILGNSAIQGDGVFTLTRTATGVRAEKSLTNGLVIVKDFAPTTNFLITANVWLENRSAGPLALPEQEWTIGTATPMNADDRGTPYIGLMWSDGDKFTEMPGASYFSSRNFACMPRVPPAEYRITQTTNIAWAAVHNQYFALAVVARQAPEG